MMRTLIRGPEVEKYQSPNGFYVSKVFSSVSTNDNHIYRHLLQQGYSTKPQPIFHHYKPIHTQHIVHHESPVFPTPSAPPLPSPSALVITTPSVPKKTSTPSRFGVTLEEIQEQKQKIQNFECPPGTKRQGLKCLPASEFMSTFAKNQ